MTSNSTKINLLHKLGIEVLSNAIHELEIIIKNLGLQYLFLLPYNWWGIYPNEIWIPELESVLGGIRAELYPKHIKKLNTRNEAIRAILKVEVSLQFWIALEKWILLHVYIHVYM